MGGIKSWWGISVICIIQLCCANVTWSMSMEKVVSNRNNNGTHNHTLSLRQEHNNNFVASPRAIKKPFGIKAGDENFANSPFVQSHWTIWDKPDDQVAVEEGSGFGGIRGKLIRKGKQYSNGTRYHHQAGATPQLTTTYNNMESKSSNVPMIMTSNPSYGTQRQDCNSNMQVTFFPIILVLIAAIAGLITVVIVWFIARKWTDWGTPTSTGHQYGGGSYGGWNNNQGRSISSYNDNLFGLQSALKNVDFNQLTNLVIKGIERYHPRNNNVTQVKETQILI